VEKGKKGQNLRSAITASLIKLQSGRRVGRGCRVCHTKINPTRRSHAGEKDAEGKEGKLECARGVKQSDKKKSDQMMGQNGVW